MRRARYERVGNEFYAFDGTQKAKQLLHLFLGGRRSDVGHLNNASVSRHGLEPCRRSSIRAPLRTRESIEFARRESTTSMNQPSNTCRPGGP